MGLRLMAKSLQILILRIEIFLCFISTKSLQRRDERKLCISCPLPASEASSTSVSRPRLCVSRPPLKQASSEDLPQPTGPRDMQHPKRSQHAGRGHRRGHLLHAHPTSLMPTPSCWVVSGAWGCFLPACRVPGELTAPLPQKRSPEGPRGGVQSSCTPAVQPTPQLLIPIWILPIIICCSPRVAQAQKAPCKAWTRAAPPHVLHPGSSRGQGDKAPHLRGRKSSCTPLRTLEGLGGSPSGPHLEATVL